jgi:hypothetical protein
MFEALAVQPLSFKRDRFPADVIRYAVWLYLRFPSSSGPRGIILDWGSSGGLTYGTGEDFENITDPEDAPLAGSGARMKGIRVNQDRVPGAILAQASRFTMIERILRGEIHIGLTRTRTEPFRIILATVGSYRNEGVI